MKKLIENICDKLNCTSIAADLEEINNARETLTRFQQREIFNRIFGSNNYDIDDLNEEDYIERFQYVERLSIDVSNTELNDVKGTEVELDANQALVEECEEEEETGLKVADALKELPDDIWLGNFKGYKMLEGPEDSLALVNKKCIELSLNECHEELLSYLRCGIRCFVIDLFTGTDTENQKLIVGLYENELNYSRQIGFPILTTLIAKLSPRLQYTGIMDLAEPKVRLEKGEKITLTTERMWSWRSSKKRIYVNAQFLIEAVKEFDFILIGCDIQLWVRKIKEARLECVVEVGGVLTSHMPVLFPGRCNKFGISQEELEDITFCKEVGINVIVSYIAGTKEYLDNLKEVLRLLQCDKMRIFARIVLNDIKGCEKDMSWAADNYDGFIVELNDSDADPEGSIMHLCPAAVNFIERAHRLKKAIIFDPSPIANKRLLLEPEHHKYVFYYPDRYIYKCDRPRNSFYFHLLYEAIAPSIIECALSKQPYCDGSLTGSDSLARACVSASFEMNASAILVCGLTGRMAHKIAHFRPKSPIIFITPMRSAAKFISVYHHITMLSTCGKCENTHQVSVYKKFLFGLLYAKTERLLKHNENVIFVYNEEPGTRCLEKYVVYKFHENFYPKHLQKILFSTD